ncbi:16S rRNA (cytidine(1402)-2'-O)-methyltransferase [uncultured Draconibacterium sp.]|uniref:16S rRNA (cytidine(1402)-2'-O)-methyltransferase n=1 Tax=uncultured Draconibacterium sp. TaxID=1573823 RepID=UPI0025CD50EC|nr:16S rRNA (cytidine(1402)-2'-O)-methyltransferase [uncultured Draconibacterium sp.]
MDNEARLILVPTPIGNLQDITYRAVEALKTADIILAEDTRVSSKLLKHLEIDKRLSAHHKFNEHKTATSIVSKIEQGNVVALISDAGTPAISDPGFLLVRACVEKNIKVECLPGPTALIPALAVSGLPTDKFVFEGFLPQKKGRQTRLKLLAEEPRTMIFYESPYRLVKALGQFAEYFGANRKACVCRELSKMFEEVKRGTVTELGEYYTERQPKGEIVIVVEGKA